MADNLPSQSGRAIREKLSYLFSDALDIGRHTITMLLSLFSIWIITVTIQVLLGKSSTFFGVIPVEYIFDLAAVAMLLKFLGHLIIKAIYH